MKHCLKRAGTVFAVPARFSNLCVPRRRAPGRKKAAQTALSVTFLSVVGGGEIGAGGHDGQRQPEGQSRQLAENQQ